MQKPKKTKKLNSFRTILYFPTNNKILVLIFVAWLLPEAKAELVYDCTDQSNPVHAFSLVDVKECPDFKNQYGPGSDQRVQIISKSIKRFINATKVRYILILIYTAGSEMFSFREKIEARKASKPLPSYLFAPLFYIAVFGHN